MPIVARACILPLSTLLPTSSPDRHTATDHLLPSDAFALSALSSLLRIPTAGADPAASEGRGRDHPRRRLHQRQLITHHRC